MEWFLFILILMGASLLLIRARNRSIISLKSQRRHFHQLAESLQLKFHSDEYFVLLEGKWDQFRVAVLPHQFEGPGSLTLIYMETLVPAIDRNWIEPNLSIGRAIVESKRNASFGYEVTGTDLPSEKILRALTDTNYPYAAVTLPTRFIYSPLLQQILASWKNFVVLIALDQGRKPSHRAISIALQNAEIVARECSCAE